ncbi:unnamed protein product, partial [Porites evermanni]
RLDEDGKVLSPEEILYRAVQSINMSHDAANSQMDIKFRSLICYGLKTLASFAFNLNIDWELTGEHKTQVVDGYVSQKKFQITEKTTHDDSSNTLEVAKTNAHLWRKMESKN